MFTKYFVSLCLLPVIISAPASTNNLAVDTFSYCGQYDTVKAGQYSLLTNQWGSSYATSGSICAAITSLTSMAIAWETKWDWQGGDGVKSFTNVQLNSGLNKQLSTIKNIPATWQWSQSASGNVVSNVAYDLFMSSTSGGKNDQEVMIWIAKFNAGPISTKYNADGTARPIAKNIPLANQRWNLYSGSNGYNNVFSFLPTKNAHLKNFKGDLNVFLKYLTQTGRISATHFLTTAQGGTEATLGSATFTTSKYSLAIN